MNKEQEQVWDRLRYGLHKGKGSLTVTFIGDGVARTFTSSWSNGMIVHHVTVDDVAQSSYRDFEAQGNRVEFRRAPPDGAEIRVEAFYE